MNIYEEINALPNFSYIFEDSSGKIHITVLGGQSCAKSKSYENIESINRTHLQMEQLYCKGNLSDEDKTHLAKLMKRMQYLCEKRKEGLYTLDEQRTYIDDLTTDEKAQIEKQIQMYKDCRCFHRDFIHNRR